jgi:hypothetical protein
MKHRSKSSKLKYEHALIEGLRHSWKALRPGRRFIRLFPDELDRPRVPNGGLDWKSSILLGQA